MSGLKVMGPPKSHPSKETKNVSCLNRRLKWRVPKYIPRPIFRKENENCFFSE